MLFMVYKTPGAKRERRNTQTSTGGLIVENFSFESLFKQKMSRLKYSLLNTLGCEATHVRSQSRLRRHGGKDIVKKKGVSPVAF